MAAALKYIVDDKGQKTAVLIPVKIWEDMNVKYQKLEKKMEILTGIQSGLREVKQARKTGKKLQTLKDFLNES